MVSVSLLVLFCLLLVATATALPVFFRDIHGKRAEREINLDDTVEHTAGLGPDFFDPDSAKLMVGFGTRLSPTTPWRQYNIQAYATVMVKWVASKERDPYRIGVDTNPSNEAAFLDHLQTDADHGSTEEKRFRILHDKMSEGDPRTLLYNIARGLNLEAALRVQGMVSKEHFAQLITQRCRVPPHLSSSLSLFSDDYKMQTPLHAAARSTAESADRVDLRLLSLLANAAARARGLYIKNGYGCTPCDVYTMYAKRSQESDVYTGTDISFLCPKDHNPENDCQTLEKEQRHREQQKKKKEQHKMKEQHKKKEQKKKEEEQKKEDMDKMTTK